MPQVARIATQCGKKVPKTERDAEGLFVLRTLCPQADKMHAVDRRFADPGEANNLSADRNSCRKSLVVARPGDEPVAESSSRGTGLARGTREVDAGGEAPSIM